MIGRRGWMVLALATAGCATSQESKSATAAGAPSGDEAHAEIARLEQRIAKLEAKIGLAPAPEESRIAVGAEPASPAAPGAPGVTLEEKIDASKKPMERPAPVAATRPKSDATFEAPVAAPPPATTPAPIQPRPQSDSAAEVASTRGSHKRSWRCRGVDRAAGEICDASDRICRLAHDLAGESEAARSCDRAREECGRARNLAGGCE